MGCGSSAKPAKYDAGNTTDGAPSGKPEEKASSESVQAPAVADSGKGAREDKSLSSNASGGEKRRPSLSREVEVTLPAHEGHDLAKDETGRQMQRPSQVQTTMELWWMDSIPEMYSVEDSDPLRHELKEDAQAEKVKECVARPEQVPQMLKEWLHDCPNPKLLDVFIERVAKEVKTICLDAKKQKLPKNVTIKAGEGDGSKRGCQRKGTGFVTAGQVRALMAADYSDSESEESDEEQDDEEFERELNARLDRKSNAFRVAVASEQHSVPDDWKPPCYEKTASQRSRIAEAVSESFMFAALGFEQLQPIIDAFKEVSIEAGVTVIEEDGEVGPTDNGLFVLESGEMEVFKKGKTEAVFTYTEMG